MMAIDGYTYYDVLEARRAAEMLARNELIDEPALLERIKSAAGRAVALHGSVTVAEIRRLLTEDAAMAGDGGPHA